MKYSLNFTGFSIIMGGILNNPSLTFNDGVRSIDYVLVWDKHKENTGKPENKQEAIKRREIFEANLEGEGLQLERENPEHLHELNFVKVMIFILSYFTMSCHETFSSIICIS